MFRYSVKNVHDQKIDQWVKLGVNVMLVGEHGTGKTQRVLEGFQRNNLKYVYFSGATLDPWLHLIGVPDISEKKMAESGRKCIEFILPEGIDDELEAIFMDEYNRSHKVVRNALLELQQFKSINGRKFPKLKLVWAAVNPPKEEDDIGFQYDVDEPDPAQVDRFHMIVEIPSIPDPKYFKKRFGNHVGDVLIKWWKKQAKEGQQACSPRRLEYAGDLFQKGADLSDVLSPICNIEDLVKALGEREEDVILKQILADPTGAVAKNFLGNPENFYKVEDEMKKPALFPAYIHVSDEIKAAALSNLPMFKRFALASAVANQEWAEAALIEGGYDTELDTVRAVLDSNWPDIYSANAVDIKKVKVELSEGDTTVDRNAQKIMFEDAIKNGNYNIPNEYYAGILNKFESKSFANTYWHKRAFYWLRNCHELIDPILVTNVVLSVYASLRKDTIQSFNGFSKLFNRIFLESFNRLSPSDRAKAARLFNKMEEKHDDYKEIVKLISNNGSDKYVGALPQEVDSLIESALEATA